ncbi:MAG: fluoride efflux transporter CrcB [Edaphocola sp.]
MKGLLYIFVGSGLGGLLRYGFGKWVNSLWQSPYPWGTFAVNVAACLLLGFVVGQADVRGIISPAARLFWIVGICGGFSTFSSFGYETLLLIQGGHYAWGAAYVIGSLIAGVLSIVAGMWLAGWA